LPSPTNTHSVGANDKGWHYTIPTVQFPDTWVMDSQKIAAELERRQPEPSLRLDSPRLGQVDALTNEVLNAVLPNALTLIPEQVLNEPSAAHWNRTRAAALGVASLEDIVREKGGEKAFDAARPALEKLTALLRETEGPYFDGNKPGFTDFVWVGFLLFVKRLGDAVFDAIVDRTGDRAVHEKLVEACGAWTDRKAE
jgi:glutathione S-transferase